MSDFATFRQQARAAFPDLIVSVMMYEKGSGVGGEVTIYRAKVAGMAIGADIKTQSDCPQNVLEELIRQVARARQAVKQAHHDRLIARNGGSRSVAHYQQAA